MSFKKYDQNQMDLLPRSVHDYLPEGHVAKVVNAVVESLDLTRIRERYSPRGCAAYDPGMLVKILFYGYACGERSSRKLGSRLESDLAYLYLAGHQCPDFRTINRFRKDHLDLLKELFGQIVRLCLEMGMVHLGRMALDGSKFKANAAERQVRRKEDLEREMEQILQEAQEVDDQEDREYGEHSPYEGLPEIQEKEDLLRRLKEARQRLEQEGRKQINLTDGDARTMLHQNRYPLTSYNGQLAVEGEKGLIVAATVSTSPTDHSAVQELVEQEEEQVGERPREVLADSGFSSYANMVYLEERGITGYIPDPKLQSVEQGTSKHPEFTKSQFHYDPERDQYICPEGQPLPYWGRQKDKLGVEWTVYRGSQCAGCPRKRECTRSKARRITRHPQEEVVERMRERLHTPEGKRIYAQRQTLVEPVFGHLKHNWRFRDLLLRGKAQVTGEFFLMCIGYNLKKIAKFLSPSPKTSWGMPQKA